MDGWIVFFFCCDKAEPELEEWAAVAFLLDLHWAASSALTQMRRLQFTVAVISGLFGQWLNFRHYCVTLLFSSPASDSFPKGQLEVQSSHTQCFWHALQVKLQPLTPSPGSLLQRWLLKTWKYCLFPREDCEFKASSCLCLNLTPTFQWQTVNTGFSQ